MNDDATDTPGLGADKPLDEPEAAPRVTQGVAPPVAHGVPQPMASVPAGAAEFSAASLAAGLNAGAENVSTIARPDGTVEASASRSPPRSPAVADAEPAPNESKRQRVAPPTGFDNASLRRAVELYLRDPTAAERKHGRIARWNVSNVTDMSSMFSGARAFNGDLSGWGVSNVTDMSHMFNVASAFNADLSRWDVTSVHFMHSMFHGARAFNGDLSGWDVSNVTDMGYMFLGARAFEWRIGTGWAARLGLDGEADVRQRRARALWRKASHMRVKKLIWRWYESATRHRWANAPPLDGLAFMG